MIFDTFYDALDENVGDVTIAIEPFVDDPDVERFVNSAAEEALKSITSKAG